MSPPRPNPTASAVAAEPQWPLVLAGSIVVFAGILAYSNSLNVPFLFDDLSSITRNATIRDFWSFNALVAPLNATGATGRPLVNLSLALNYALGGTAVRGYHVFNLLVHLASALLLLGIVRRTLAAPSLRDRYGPVALPLAAGISLLWTVHPLQTESVTCIIQRTELLGGFFLLLTLYCFVRSVPDRAAGDPSGFRWSSGAIAACALGMAAKEFTVTAPLLVLLYDRTFAAGTFRSAWRQGRRLYLGLAACWLVLAAILVQSPQRNHNVGFGLGVSAWDYLLTQCHAIVVYLKLVLWPHPLVLDYGIPLVHHPGDVAWQGLLLVALFLGALRAMWRRPAIGFIGAWFFVILSPSSSFIPLTTQTMAEHRMYLPLVALIVLTMLGLWRYAGRYAPVAALGLGAVLAALTWTRNQDYASGLSIWLDTATKVPGNFRAQYNLGNALAAAGRPADALPRYEAALRLRSDDPSIRYNYATTLSQLGRSAEAIAQFQAALKCGPEQVDILVNLGSALAQAGRFPEAVVAYRRSAELDPKAADIRVSLGSALIATGQVDEGLRALEAAVALQPGDLDARVQLADTLVEAGRGREAIAHYETALRLNPGATILRERLRATRQRFP